MIFPSRALRLGAAAFAGIAVGVGMAMAAPALVVDEADYAAIDLTYVPGDLGIDYAAVTGPTQTIGPGAASLYPVPAQRSSGCAKAISQGAADCLPRGYGSAPSRMAPPE